MPPLEWVLIDRLIMSPTLGVEAEAEPPVTIGWKRSLASRTYQQATGWHHVSSSRPCFSTIARSLSAVPLGCFAPVSHFSTVDSLVFR